MTTAQLTELARHDKLYRHLSMLQTIANKLQEHADHKYDLETVKQLGAVSEALGQARGQRWAHLQKSTEHFDNLYQAPQSEHDLRARLRLDQENY